MTTADRHETGHAGPGGGRPLSEAELLVGGWQAIKAFVPNTDGRAGLNGRGASSQGQGASLGSRGSGPEDHSVGPKKKSRAAERKGEERRVLRELGRGQLNVVTSLHPTAREAVKRLAEALLTDEKSMKALAAANSAVIGTPTLRDMVVCANGDDARRAAVHAACIAPELVARGRETSEAAVRSLIDAVLGQSDLRDLVGAALAAQTNASSWRTWSSGVRPAVAVLTDAELQDCVRAVMKDARLLALLVAICNRPTMRAAVEAVSVNDHVAVDAVEIAVRRPDAARYGLRLVEEPGLRGWLTRTLMGM